MSTSDQILCELCHERRSTHHISYGGTGKTNNLCDECFQASAPPDVLQCAAAVRDAPCQYCGGQPCAGGNDMLALITGVQESKYMCMPCSMEYHRFLQQQLSPGASDLSQQEQVNVVRKLLQQADAHMKQWLLKRGSR